jgi:hypothetical protein
MSGKSCRDRRVQPPKGLACMAASSVGWETRSAGERRGCGYDPSEAVMTAKNDNQTYEMDVSIRSRRRVPQITYLPSKVSSVGRRDMCSPPGSGGMLSSNLRRRRTVKASSWPRWSSMDAIGGRFTRTTAEDGYDDGRKGGSVSSTPRSGEMSTSRGAS